TRSTEAKSLDDEGMVVLLLTLLIGPVVGPHASGHHELITLAGILGERLTQRSEGHEPDGRDHFARGALFVPARVVVADQAEVRIQGVTFGDELRISGKIADRGQRE